MALRAKKPEIKEKRLKMFVFGPAGIGKTIAALQFPDAYIIDAEKGTDFYSPLINEKNSVVLQTYNIDEIRAEIKALLTTNHNYRTLIIDPITQIYNATQEKWTRIFEKYADTEKQKEVGDFGMRYWGKVKGEFKSLQRMLILLDMNIIITAHQKDVYGNGFSKIGVTFDSMKGEDYLYDLVFMLSKKGTARVAETIKERALIGLPKFPQEFEWSYANFLKYYGQEIIEKKSEAIKMATESQVERLMKLIETVKVEESTLEKWKNQTDVDDWAEMTEAQILKCIEHLEAKLTQITGGK